MIDNNERKGLKYQRETADRYRSGRNCFGATRVVLVWADDDGRGQGNRAKSAQRETIVRQLAAVCRRAALFYREAEGISAAAGDGRGAASDAAGTVVLVHESMAGGVRGSGACGSGACTDSNPGGEL